MSRRSRSSAQSSSSTPAPYPLVFRPPKPPCSLCRRAKRPCRFESSPDNCKRCLRLGFPCPGSTLPESFARGAEEKRLQVLNIRPSSPAQNLPRGVLATALVYDLVRSYKGHLEGVTAVDPDLARFHLNALRCTGRIDGLDNLIEIRYLVYLIGGAKLSRHSAIVGTAKCDSEIDSFANFTRQGLSASSIQERRQVGLIRQSALQDMSNRLMRRIESLKTQVTPETFSELFSITWIAIRELGAAGVDRAVIRQLIERLYPVFSGLTGALSQKPDKRPFLQMLGLINSIAGRDPNHVFHCFLSKYDPERTDKDWTYVVPPTLREGFNAAANTQPALPLQLLSDNEIYVLLSSTRSDIDESTKITKAASNAVLARQRTLKEWLVYADVDQLMSRVPLLWAELQRVEEFLTSQSEALWNAWSNSLPPRSSNSTKTPIGLTIFLIQLVKLQSAHVLFVRSLWAAVRESGSCTVETDSAETKLYGAIDSWVLSLVRLMESTSESEGYDLGITITQTLSFMKGSELSKWSSLNPHQAWRLIRVLDYLSVALPNAGKLREILANSATEELELADEHHRIACGEKEKVREAQKIVEVALEDITS